MGLEQPYKLFKTVSHWIGTTPSKKDLLRMQVTISANSVTHMNTIHRN